ncbi:MAG TPA: hypothetical protein PLO37_20445 [Candidatus Hydrogenedentes bacterium]|nr:hypothetical protein [Candidatus Hydrogenedentota bacterium]HPG69225.1 hypothetical protein [Candidatus Hydrogenedentota bacterium]
MANQPTVVGDEIGLYSTAIPTTHGGYIPKKRITVARAAWTRDRFVSLDAEGVGEVQTRAFACPGRRVHVNADVSGGDLAVAVLDDQGAALPSYSVEQCVRVNGDHLRHAVRWQSTDALPEGQSIQLRFHLTNAQLFSYTIE